MIQQENTQSRCPSGQGAQVIDGWISIREGSNPSRGTEIFCLFLEPQRNVGEGKEEKKFIETGNEQKHASQTRITNTHLAKDNETQKKKRMEIQIESNLRLVSIPSACILPIQTLPKHSSLKELAVAWMEVFDTIHTNMQWIRILAIDPTLVEQSTWLRYLLLVWDAFVHETSMLHPVSRMTMDAKIKMKDSRLQPAWKQWVPRRPGLHHYKSMIKYFEPMWSRFPYNDRAALEIKWSAEDRNQYKNNPAVGRVRSICEFHQSKKPPEWVWNKDELEDATTFRIHETGAGGDCFYYVLSQALRALFGYGGSITSSKDEWMMNFRSDVAHLLTDQRFIACNNTFQAQFGSRLDYGSSSRTSILIPSTIRSQVIGKKGMWGDDHFLPLVVLHPLMSQYRLGVLMLSETEQQRGLTIHRVASAYGLDKTNGYLMMYHSPGHYQLITCDFKLIVSDADAKQHPLLRLWLQTQLPGHRPNVSSSSKKHNIRPT